jgi:sigma-B regulation protein RsbU (phosphoserine phosphatase)
VTVPGIRLGFWRLQALTLSIALAVFFLLWAVAPQNGFRALLRSLAITLIYTLFVANLALFFLPRLMSRTLVTGRFTRFAALSGYAVALSLAGSAVAGTAVFILGLVTPSEFWRMFWRSGAISAIVNGMAALPFYHYTAMRSDLEQRNEQLTEAVATRQAELQSRAEDFETAREIQESLLPKHLPKLRGCTVSGCWKPALSVGGDYYDVIPLGESEAALIIADVVGKGVAAALLMANLQAAVRAFASLQTAPRDLCGRINSAFAKNLASGKYITFFYGVINTSARTLTYCNAGHNAPLCLSRSSLMRLDAGGPVLGVFPAYKYEQDTVQLEPGDHLLLYTDGLTEAESPSGEEFGEDRLVEILRATAESPANVMEQQIVTAATEFCRGAFHDDLTVLAIALDHADLSARPN